MEIKGAACVFGAVLINLTLGTFYSIGNVMPYIASYMRNNGNESVTTELASWITATFLLGQAFFMIVGSWVEGSFGSRVACILGCIIQTTSTALTILSVKYSFTIVILTYGFGCGLGSGLAYIAGILAAQKWFPFNKGFITGIIVAGFGIGGLIFTTLQTAFMNPQNDSPLEDGYFGSNVADKVPKLFVYSSIMYAIMQTIGCILIFQPPTPTNDSRQSNNIIVSEYLPEMHSYFDAFKYRVFYISGLVFVLLAPGVTFVNSLGKRYGQVFINDDKFLATAVALSSIGNAGGRLFWGFLLDKLSFTMCLSIKVIFFATLITLFPFEFILESKAGYLIVMLGLFFGFSGSFVMLPVFVEQVFGSKYSGQIYGTLFVFLALSSIVTSVLNQFVLSPLFAGKPGAKLFTYRFVPCAIIASLYIIALIIYFACLPTKRIELSIMRRKDAMKNKKNDTLYHREDLFPLKTVVGGTKGNAEKSNLTNEASLGSIVKYRDSKIADKLRGA